MLALLAALLAALCATTFELVFVGYRHGLSAFALLVLGGATFALTLPVAGVLGLVTTALCSRPRLRGLLDRVRRHPLVGGALLAVAAGIQYVDATYYVRLYFSLHLACALVSLVFAFAGFLLLVPSVRACSHRWRFAGLVGASLLWATLTAISLALLLDRPGIRSVALERTSLLHHELHLLDRMTGMLAEPAVVFDTQDPAIQAVVHALEPRPLQAPQGRLRGANILLVTVDSMRADRLGVAPTMKSLADDGVSFERAWSPSCWTIGSMGATFTSRYASALRYTQVSVDRSLRFQAHADDDPFVLDAANFKKVTPVPMNDPSPTLAELLSKAGYQTATAIAYVFYLPAAGLVDGFELVDEKPYREHNVDNQGITSEALTSAAIDFLAHRDSSRPFFLWLHYMDPHAPYVARDDAASGGGPTARYDSELRAVDAELGRLVKELRSRGLWDDTIVVLHGDHGEEFREHGGEFHATTVYDEVSRVPFVVRLPGRAGVTPGRRLDTPVSLLDLMPTLLDLVGVPASEPMMGRSLWPLLGGEPLAPRPVITECRRFGRDRRALVDWPHKLSVDRSTGSFELYDLVTDPLEQANLVDRSVEVFVRLASLVQALE